jgi:hypothetical protein
MHSEVQLDRPDLATRSSCSNPIVSVKSAWAWRFDSLHVVVAPGTCHAGA